MARLIGARRRRAAAGRRAPPRPGRAASRRVAGAQRRHHRRRHRARREPAARPCRRSGARADLRTWTTTRTALSSCACTAAGPSPASAPRASNRATASALVLACRVPQPPSCPVLSAVSSSRTSAPRTSPTTSRSGRIRSDWRTRAVRLTSPLPSTLAGRACSRTTCGWSTASSRTSSTTTSRSSGSALARAGRPSSVVLPLPVPPLTTKATRRWTRARRTVRPRASKVPQEPSSARDGATRRGTRRLMWGPSAASGGSTACRRTPPGQEPVDVGARVVEAAPGAGPPAGPRAGARRRRRPPRTARAPAPHPRSTQTPVAPLTRTSVTDGSAR